jgi:phosphoglycolate phosphatase
MKTVLFDLDGTLTDSGEGIINCAWLALEYFGIPLPTREEMRVFVGPPLRDSFLRFGVPEDGVEKAIEIYRSRYVPTGMFENSPYPGIVDLLTALRKKGFRLYVATSKPEGMATAILEKFNLAKYFDLICGASMDDTRDSKDKVIAYLIGKAGDDAYIMVGDTAFDVEGAAVNGIPTIGVAWGYGKVEDMVKAGAKDIAHSPAHLLELLQA